MKDLKRLSYILSMIESQYRYYDQYRDELNINQIVQDMDITWDSVFMRDARSLQLPHEYMRKVPNSNGGATVSVCLNDSMKALLKNITWYFIRALTCRHI